MFIKITVTAIAILMIFIIILFTVKNRNRNSSKDIIKFIKKKYEDTWGSVESLDILGIHHLAEFKDNKRHILLVVMFRNGRLAHSFSEVKFNGKNMLHKRMSELEKDRFLKSNPDFYLKYSKLLTIYESH